MKIVFGIALCVVALVSGCAKPKSVVVLPPVAQPGKPVVTPDFRAVGTVASVNADGRFAVLNYAVSEVPRPGQLLSVYRNGLKVGELKVTGPQRDGNTVADIVTGEAEPKDETREQ